MTSSPALATPAPELAAEEPLATISRRLLAWAVDVVFVTVLVFVGVSIVDAVLGPAVSFRPEAAALPDTVAVDKGVVAADAFIATGLSAAYFVVPWALWGGSPVQLALRLRVRGEAGRDLLPVGRAITRWVLLFPPFATVSALAAGVPLLGWFVWVGALVWYLVLLLTAARSETNRGLHDRLAGSVVYKSRAAVG
jgi:RDD family